MKRFFNAEAPLWKLLGSFGEIFLLSLMWFLGSVPVLTLGASSTALYDTIIHSIRKREDDIFTRYLHTFKNEFKLTVPCSLLWTALIGGLFFLYRTFTDSAGITPMVYVLSVALLCLQIFTLGVACWVFPLLSRFSFGFVSLNVAALKLAVVHPLRTAAIGLITAICLWLCVRFLLPVTFLPGLCMLLRSYLLEPVFEKLQANE